MVRVKYADFETNHSSDFEFSIPSGYDCWLLIITHTPAIFLIENELKEYPANHAILYKPKTPIYYRACTDTFIDDWIQFYTDETYITATPMPIGVPFAVSDFYYCHKLCELIAMEYILNNTYREISIANLLRTLSNKLLESYTYKDVSALHKNLNELRMDIHLNPNRNWTVKEMAARLNVSVGYLEDIYKTAFGINCIDDVIQNRINLAKGYLLHEKSTTIAEIATLCGYQSIEHFYRQFKKNTGLTPNKFRNSGNAY